MGSKTSKCKTHTSKNHIYYALKFKKSQEVSIIDSDVLKNKDSSENNDSNMYITFDAEDMKNNTNKTTSSKLKRENILDCESHKLKEIGQFWPSSSRENVTDQKRTNSIKSALTQLEREEQTKHLNMSSKGKLLWASIDEGSKRSVKSTAAQAGSFVTLREGSIFKSRSFKESNSSGSSSNQKEPFSDSKPRCQSEYFDQSGAKRKNKHPLRNNIQLDSSFENLSDTHSTVRSRDLELRLRGAGNGESHSKNRSMENVDPRSKNNEYIKESHTAQSNKSDADDSTFSNDYIDARWQALCISNDKEQVLVPCPTCGRRFNEDAAYRHFPICSKVKEKGSSVRGPKNIVKPTSSPNSPSFVNVMPDDPLDINKRDDGSGRKPAKPIVFTFTRGGHKLSNKTPEVKEASKSSEQCKQTVVSSTKCFMKHYSPATSKKGSGNSIAHKPDVVESKHRKRKTSAPSSDGVRKSASIWKKSIKEFKTIADITSIKTTHSSMTDESSASNKVEAIIKVPITTSTDESRNHFTVAESRCQNCGKLNSPTEKIRIGPRAKSRSRKSFNGKYRAMNNKHVISRSVKDITNLQDLDVIPQNLRIKDNIENLKKNKLENSFENFESFGEKTEPCFCCTRLIPSSQMETHAYLCERIKNIEMLISKDSLKSGEPSTVSGIQPSISQKQSSSGAQSGNEVRVDSVTPKDYRLFKQGSETPSAICLRTVTSMKCPCCAQILELRRK